MCTLQLHDATVTLARAAPHVRVRFFGGDVGGAHDAGSQAHHQIHEHRATPKFSLSTTCCSPARWHSSNATHVCVWQRQSPCVMRTRRTLSPARSKHLLACAYRDRCTGQPLFRTGLYAKVPLVAACAANHVIGAVPMQPPQQSDRDSQCSSADGAALKRRSPSTRTYNLIRACPDYVYRCHIRCIGGAQAPLRQDWGGGRWYTWTQLRSYIANKIKNTTILKKQPESADGVL